MDLTKNGRQNKMIHKGYKYRIYPNENQRVFLAKHFGCVRFVYNWGLDIKVKEYQKNKKSPSCFDLIKMLVALKKKYEWLSEISSQSLQMSVRNLDSAFKRFFKTKKGFPKFKSKKTNSFSFQCSQKYKIKGKELFIPKLKTGIKIKQHRNFKGKMKTLTISKNPSDQYFASILVETTDNVLKKKPIKEKTATGIDLGIKDFAILSNGEKIKNPRYLKDSLAKLKIAQKRLSKKKAGGCNRRKQRLKVARLHQKISNQRKDFLHKNSKQIIENQDTICIEDLNVKGMVRNHCLAQAISDVSWGEFRRQLEYKSNWYGKNLVVIGRFEPSSRVCECGYKNNALKLSDREWTCPECDQTHDRDILAAKNIKRFGLAKVGTGRVDFKPVEKQTSMIEALASVTSYISAK